jgi:hypothetical protein
MEPESKVFYLCPRSVSFTPMATLDWITNSPFQLQSSKFGPPSLPCPYFLIMSASPLCILQYIVSKMSRKRTAAERFGQQFDDVADGLQIPDSEGAERPQLEEFDEYDDSHLKRKSKKARLSFKGDLDASLSTGKYAAKPASTKDLGNFESELDDMFGILDADIEGEGGATNLRSEKEYEEWFEENKDRVVTSAPAGQDEDVLAQLEALRKKQQQRLKTDSTVLPEEGEGDSEAFHGSIVCAKSLLAGFTDLVTLRAKMQPLIRLAGRLPDSKGRTAFCSTDASVQKVYSAVSKQLLEVLHQLFAATGLMESDGPTPSMKLCGDLAQQFHKTAMKSADATVATWGDHAAARVLPPKGSKYQLEVINRSLADQIRGVLEGGKLRILDRTRRSRTHEIALGNQAQWKETPAEKAIRIADGDLSPDYFDDSDFLRELIHRTFSAANVSQLRTTGDGVDSKAGNSTTMADIERQLGLTSEAELSGLSRKGFHRLLKGKKVSMDPRPKLVGFMAPVPYPATMESSEGDRHQALLRSLFR